MYIPEHNRLFSVAPSDPTSVFVKTTVDLDAYLCIEEDRVVSNHNVVSYNNIKFDIRSQSTRSTFARRKVKVRQHLDGTYSIAHGTRILGRYGAEGKASEEKRNAA